MNTLLQQVRAQLKQHIDAQYLEDNKKYFKDGIVHHGVRTPQVRAIARKHYPKNASKKELYQLCTQLLASTYNEESTIAIQWIAKHNDYALTDFNTFNKWMAHLDNWGKIDDFCLSVLSHYLVQYPQCKDHVKKWSASTNKWKRRSSAVAFIQGGSWTIHNAFLPDVFEIALTLMNDPEDLVQKGMGWMLKIAAKTHLREVFDFVMQHKHDMQRVALRYAIENMPPNLKKQAMAK